MELYHNIRFGKLTDNIRHHAWTTLGKSFVLHKERGTEEFVVAQCDCGTIAVVRVRQITSGGSIRCRSCASRERGRKHGMHGTPEYNAWSAIIQRCTNEAHPYYSYYGGRGIKVCDDWRDSFESFFNAVGRRPSPYHEIDRINNEGNYEPGNVRWATGKENSRNTRRNRFVVVNGKRVTYAELYDMFPSLGKDCIRYRLRAGWSIQQIAKVPKHRRRHGTQGSLGG